MLPAAARQALENLASHDVAVMLKGLSELESEWQEIADVDLGEVLNAVNAIFYYDTYEYPQFQAAVDAAVSTVSKLGERVIPHLLRNLGDSDFKVEFSYALIFGIIGAPAVGPLLQAYQERWDSTERAFILYSLGKIKSPELQQAQSLLLNELKSPMKEIRDSAARTLGKTFENVAASEVEAKARGAMFHGLMQALRDSQPGIRAKACRSLGKMARHGYLQKTELAELGSRVATLLGKGEGNWDEAFVVRKEAAEVEEILERVE